MWPLGKTFYQASISKLKEHVWSFLIFLSFYSCDLELSSQTKKIAGAFPLFTHQKGK
jgi:hypothetical protein